MRKYKRNVNKQNREKEKSTQRKCVTKWDAYRLDLISVIFGLIQIVAANVAASYSQTNNPTNQNPTKPLLVWVLSGIGQKREENHTHMSGINL